ncbi:Hypothetical protein GbCGDNIH9_8382 [Granulibacter bethesdensis]|uniref:Transposase n=1 Tax=Granulibacter bethesdensis TaxID=364410 RepID=A0AAC9KEF8_9PROT|nr:Hypothetical protein GbCGDNIH9_8382 [Granulibacter bethesdensis]
MSGRRKIGGAWSQPCGRLAIGVPCTPGHDVQPVGIVSAGVKRLLSPSGGWLLDRGFMVIPDWLHMTGEGRSRSRG